MLFNSLDFGVFISLIFFLYWFVFNKNIKLQNGLILVSSYVFYGWWDWRFLTLILFSTIVDYFLARFISFSKNTRKRKLFLILSILINIGLLGFFKYFNFFITSFTEAFSFFGHEIKPNTLNIILPVGISFYTFQTLSYTIDVYRKNLSPAKDFVSFASFVSFFPQLVAGPIERASNLLPQFQKSRTFEYSAAVDGLKQILWGLFKKVVIADNCAIYANHIFDNYDTNGSFILILGAVFFAFQIYGDFSGYSDIAIGTSRLFGFNLMKNFSYPYFSRDIAEFWRRWHISLSTWFRDYLYIPLGGSRGNIYKKIRNTFIIFLVSGFWHGANWTFIFWGGLNALFFLPLLLKDKNRKNLNVVAEKSRFPSSKDFFAILFTFTLTTFAWIFFRAESLDHAIAYISQIFSFKYLFQYQIMNSISFLSILGLIIFFLWIEWKGRQFEFGLQNILISSSKKFRWGFYTALIFTIIYNAGTEQEFIYFQF